MCAHLHWQSKHTIHEDGCSHKHEQTDIERDTWCSYTWTCMWPHFLSWALCPVATFDLYLVHVLSCLCLTLFHVCTSLNFTRMVEPVVFEHCHVEMDNYLLKTTPTGSSETQVNLTCMGSLGALVSSNKTLCLFLEEETLKSSVFWGNAYKMQHVACLFRLWLCFGVTVCMTFKGCRNIREVCVWYALSMLVYSGMTKCLLIHNCLHISEFLQCYCHHTGNNLQVVNEHLHVHVIC